MMMMIMMMMAITLMIAFTLLYNIWTWSMKFIIRWPTNTEWNNIEWNQGRNEHRNANFCTFFAQAKNQLIKIIQAHRRTGRGGGQNAQSLGNSDFLGSKRKLGQSQFLKTFPCFLLLLYFEDTNIFYFNQKLA